MGTQVKELKVWQDGKCQKGTRGELIQVPLLLPAGSSVVIAIVTVVIPDVALYSQNNNTDCNSNG